MPNAKGKRGTVIELCGAATTLHVQPQTWQKIEMCAAAMHKTGTLAHDDDNGLFKLEEMLNYVSVMQRQLEQDFQDSEKLRKVLPLHMRKQVMERERMMYLALMIAGFNYATDIIFLVKELLPQDKMHNLAVMLIFSLSLCLLTRAGAVVYLFAKQIWGANERFKEDGDKSAMFKLGYNKKWAALYSLASIIEPTEGLRLLEKSFNERLNFGKDFRGHDEEKDAVACFAALDLHAARSEIVSIGSGIVIDLINLITQLLFVAYSRADGMGMEQFMRVWGSLPVAFWVSFAATVLHLLFYCKEVRVTYSEITDLKKDKEREVAFNEHNTDADVVKYAKTIGNSARGIKVNPKKEKGKAATPCESVTDFALLTLGDHCPLLQYVEFTSCPRLIDPDKGWLPLVRNCRNLLHITLNSNEQVKDSWIEPLPDHCPLLQMVCMKGCKNITDRSVQALSRLQNLKYLVVSQCPNLTDKAFIGEQNFKIQALRYLAIDGLEKLTKEGIRKLLKRCGRNLECAYLDGLTKLDDDIMVDVAEACHGLKKIGMKGCVGIGDATVSKLCKCCLDIEQLGVSFCPEVSIASVHAIQELKHLQKLFMEKDQPANLSKEAWESQLAVWRAELTQLVEMRGPKGTSGTTALKTVYGPLRDEKLTKKIADEQNELPRSGNVNPVHINRQALRAESARVAHRFKLISGLQNGVDRGAMLGIDRARMRGVDASSVRDVSIGGIIGGVSTGGFMPLGFKCDDFIQDSVIDTSDEAKESIRKEGKWVDEPMCEKMPEYIERFGMRELPSKAHKVSFKDKDLRNADDSDIVIAFRADVPNSGAGTEQTLNYALFGEYVFVEQFKNDKKAGGALLRDGMITNPGSGVQWREEQCRQRIPSPGSGDEARCPRLEFRSGKEYCVWKTFTHTTPKDEAKTAQKGRDCFKMQPVTAAQLQGSGGEGGGREWVMQKARCSAVSFVLKRFDSDSSSAESYDNNLVRQLVEFVQDAEEEGHGKPLKIMVTGPTEKVQPGVEERTANIFKRAFDVLLWQHQGSLSSRFQETRKVEL